MSNVYECSICGTIMMKQGLTSHMKRVHKLERSNIGEEEGGLNLVILYEDIPRGGLGRNWTKGYTIAKWLFAVKGKYRTMFARGNLNVFRLWITGRIRYVNNKYGRAVMEQLYIEDFN